MPDLNDELTRGIWRTKADRRTVGTEAMSDAARPEPRMVEVGRDSAQNARRMPVIDDPWMLKLVWWHAKLRAVATGEHVRVIETTPHADPHALDAHDASSVIRCFDGSRLPVTEAGMQEATLSVHARRQVREIEAWAQALVEGEATDDEDA